MILKTDLICNRSNLVLQVEWNYEEMQKLKYDSNYEQLIQINVCILKHLRNLNVPQIIQMVTFKLSVSNH